MDFPELYQPDRVGELYVPDTNAAVTAGRALNASPASKAQVKTILLLVDMQVDFVHTDGSLSVPGAVDDTRRVIEWIFRNLVRLTTIAASLDSHVPISIFFPTWWVDEDGQHPPPYTVIRSEDIEQRALEADLRAGMVGRILREAGRAGEKRVDDLALSHADRHAGARAHARALRGDCLSRCRAPDAAGFPRKRHDSRRPNIIRCLSRKSKCRITRWAI